MTDLPAAKGMAGSVQRATPSGSGASHVSSIVSGRSQRPSSLKKWGLRLAAPLLLAGLTVYAVNRYMSQRTTLPVAQETPVLVERIVAAQNLQVGDELSINHLALRDIAQNWVEPDSLAPEEVESVLGMRLTADLAAGMPLTLSIIRRPQPNEFLETLAPGRRAVSLPISRISSSSGLLQPEELIDLYVTFEHRGRSITSLLMSQVRVLQVARSDSERYSDDQETLTLDVSPEQAAKLIAAQQGGILTAVQMPGTANPQGREGHFTDTAIGVQPQSHSAVAANHLAGFAGVEASFQQLELPDIFYGDLETVTGQSHP